MSSASAAARDALLVHTVDARCAPRPAASCSLLAPSRGLLRRRSSSARPVQCELRAKCKPGDVIVRVDPRYFRPTEVETLLGDPTKARERLGWTPTTTFEQLVQEMVESDYTSAKRDSLVKLAGFQAYDHHE